MSDDKNENLLVSNYIKRHEAILLEHIRKQLDAESRNILLEMALNEQNKLIEDQNITISSLQDTIEQSLNSVKTTTIGRETLEKQLQELQDKYNQQGIELRELNGKHDRLKVVEEENHRLVAAQSNTSKELNDLRNRGGQLNNTVVQLQNENRELKEKLVVAENNTNTIKNNYNLVVKSLEECERSLPQTQPQKKKTKNNTPKNDSEWIDGNEISD